MHDTIKKKNYIYIYMDSNYSLFVLFFILISFGYIHEFTLSFFFLYLFIEFLMIIYVRPFVFCTSLTNLKQKFKKKKKKKT